MRCPASPTEASVGTADRLSAAGVPRSSMQASASLGAPHAAAFAGTRPHNTCSAPRASVGIVERTTQPDSRYSQDDRVADCRTRVSQSHAAPWCRSICGLTTTLSVPGLPCVPLDEAEPSGVGGEPAVGGGWPEVELGAVAVEALARRSDPFRVGVGGPSIVRAPLAWRRVLDRAEHPRRGSRLADSAPGVRQRARAGTTAPVSHPVRARRTAQAPRRVGPLPEGRPDAPRHAQAPRRAAKGAASPRSRKARRGHRRALLSSVGWTAWLRARRAVRRLPTYLSAPVEKWVLVDGAGWQRGPVQAHARRMRSRKPSKRGSP
jgi:hypothetical protein